MTDAGHVDQPRWHGDKMGVAAASWVAGGAWLVAASVVDAGSILACGSARLGLVAEDAPLTSATDPHRSQRWLRGTPRRPACGERGVRRHHRLRIGRPDRSSELHGGPDREQHRDRGRGRQLYRRLLLQQPRASAILSRGDSVEVQGSCGASAADMTSWRVSHAGAVLGFVAIRTPRSRTGVVYLVSRLSPNRATPTQPVVDGTLSR